MGQWYPFPPPKGSTATLKDGGLSISPGNREYIDECGLGEDATQYTSPGYEKPVTVPRFPPFELQLLGLGQVHLRLMLLKDRLS